MSSSPSSREERVFLYRYDLTHGMASTLGPMLLGHALEGIWHTSIVVYGTEFYFDGGVGIVGDPQPGHTRFGQPYRTEVLGSTTKRKEEFLTWTEQQSRAGFGPNDYRILDNNCNSFSDAASMFLLRRHIARDVLEMIPTLLATSMGQMLRPILEQATSGSAGVGGSSLLSSSSPLPPQLPPASFVSSSSSSGDGGGDRCEGLLSSRECITDSEEEDLMMAQAMLESNESIADGYRSSAEAFDKTISGLRLLRTVIQNICDHPSDLKYRALSVESNTYQSKLKALEGCGAAQVFRIAGFRRRPHITGGGGEQWFLSDKDGSLSVLCRVVAFLDDTIEHVRKDAEEAARKRSEEAYIPPARGADDASTPPPEKDHHAAAEVMKADKAMRNLSAEHGGGDVCHAGVLKYCAAPFPADWDPLPIGHEAGESLFSMRWRPHKTTSESSYFGKCRLNAQLHPVQASCCSEEGKEVCVDFGCEVLCVRRGQEKTLSWVPVHLLAATQNQRIAAHFCVSCNDRMAVIRAEHGCGVHPGVMMPSGCCVVPYGGAAVDVSGVAEVLCETARLPHDVVSGLAALEKGAALAEVLNSAGGKPISSFDALLRTWQAPSLYFSPQPLRPHTQLDATSIDWEATANVSKLVAPIDIDGKEAGFLSLMPSSRRGEADSTAFPRLLVCHDFGGGYCRGENRLFVYQGASPDEEENVKGGCCEVKPTKPSLDCVHGAYTVNYWSLVDCFVYFSHQRITVPPREWIENGHRHGVPVLGTIITEGQSGQTELNSLLVDAKRTAAVIARLCEVCNTYGFDGYLINIENSLPKVMAKHLVIFCAQLRKQLNCSCPTTPRQVVWYDAITISGSLSYQNALTTLNKPFFDVCDGIFTNYFWKPDDLAVTQTSAGHRAAEAYVGVDVFGRCMYGGGQYNTHVAVNEVRRARLSVALFAPGWTMECESKGTRDGFHRADSRLWSRMQGSFAYHARFVSFTETELVSSARWPARGAWTSFLSGVGYDFFVNGRCLTGEGPGLPGGGSCGWCEFSAEHELPPFLFHNPQLEDQQDVSPSSSAAVFNSGANALSFASFDLPASARPEGDRTNGIAHASWCYEKAWFGNRSLVCAVPPEAVVEVLRWYGRDALPAASSSVHPTALVIEVVFHESGGAGELEGRSRGLHLGLVSTVRGVSHVTLWEGALTKKQPNDFVACEAAGLLAHVSVSSAIDISNSDPVQEAGRGWVRVRYALQNVSAESLHLTSIAVANGDPSDTLTCCLGAIALYHHKMVPSDTLETANASKVSLLRRAPSLLCATPSHRWHEHVTFPTKKATERVLVLQNTESTFADIRTRYGSSSTVVLFAHVEVLSNMPSSEKSILSEEDRMAPELPVARHPDTSHKATYIGQYSIGLTAHAMHDGEILIPVSMPSATDVKAVYYHVIPDGY